MNIARRLRVQAFTTDVLTGTVMAGTQNPYEHPQDVYKTNHIAKHNQISFIMQASFNYDFINFDTLARIFVVENSPNSSIIMLKTKCSAKYSYYIMLLSWEKVWAVWGETWKQRAEKQNEYIQRVT